MTARGTPAVAIAWTATAVVALALLWLVAAPPGGLRTPVWTTAALVLFAGAVAALAVGGDVRSSVRAWSTTVMACVAVGLFVTSAIAWPGGDASVILAAGAAGATWVLATVVVALLRLRSRRADALTGLAILLAGIGLTWLQYEPLQDAGIRWRFHTVRERYEAAILDGTVEASGGFVDEELSGWVWADQLVLDPYAGVVHDPRQRLSPVVPRRIHALGELATCERLAPRWYWCVFS